MQEPLERSYFDKWLIADDRCIHVESRRSNRAPEHIWSVEWQAVDRFWVHHVIGTGATPEWDQLVVVAPNGMAHRAHLEAGEVDAFIELLHHNSPQAIEVKGLARYRAVGDLVLLVWNTSAFLVGAIALLCLVALALEALSRGL